MFGGKRVLVAGGTGLVGIPLVRQLVAEGARVRIASLDQPSRAHPGAEFIRVDLRSPAACRQACSGMEFVFNLLCVKGSPAVANSRPVSILNPMLLFNTNLIEAAYRAGAAGYLYTSSIGIYPPAEIFYEDNAWTGLTSPNDRFAGWAKRTGELQVEAYRIEHGWENLTIVRPANVYGPYDNFDSSNAAVIPSLIKRAVAGQNPLQVWGDGSAERDFVHAEDVARGMLLAATKAQGQILNLGSGQGASIRRLVDIVASGVCPSPSVAWDTSQPAGDSRRIMDITRARSIGWEPQISLEQGVRELIEWYRDHQDENQARYESLEHVPA